LTDGRKDSTTGISRGKATTQCFGKASLDNSNKKSEQQGNNEGTRKEHEHNDGTKTVFRQSYGGKNKKKKQKGGVSNGRASTL
jgi:hypothetical protein